MRRRVDRALVVFAKWPRAGRAKRRLAAAVGREASIALAHAFLRDTAALARNCGADELIVAYAPPSAKARFEEVFAGATLVPQPRTSFGARLERALAFGHARARSVVLIGTDSPTLDSRVVVAAFATLEGGTDCVLGPARDGGYYLIGGTRSLPPTLFRRMPWSTRTVFAVTRERALTAGSRIAVLPCTYDVDDVAALRLLRTDRAGLRRGRATAAVLRRLESV